MPHQTILIEKMEGLAVIKMNRPAELNALSQEMRREMIEAFSVLEKDRSVISVILTGGEFVFSAGADIKEMISLADTDVVQYLKSIKECLTAVYTFKKPIVAAVGGIAMGEGLNLVTLCDFVVASESAIFSHPEIKLLGINPLFRSLSDLIGTRKAMELTMLGEPIGAMEALRIGLVNRVDPLETFMEEALHVAKELSGRSPEALETLKKLAKLTPSMEKLSAMEMEFDACETLFSKKERKDYMETFLGELKKRKGK